jgi:alkylmercury lyase
MVMRTAIDLAQIAARFSAPDQEGSADFARALLRALAAGQPVARETLARSLGWSVDRVSAALEASPSTEYDYKGDIVGYGLTLRETPHVCEIDGHQIYAWCALDTLMFPAWLGSAARVRSNWAATGAPVRVGVTPDGVQEIDPAGAMVSLVPSDTAEDIRRGFCRHVHFFASAAVAQAWAAERENIAIVSVQEAFVVGRDLVIRMLGGLPRHAEDGAC